MSEIKNTSRNYWYRLLFGFTTLYRTSEIRKRHCLLSMYKSDTSHMPVECHSHSVSRLDALKKTMKHRMDSGQICPQPLQVQHDYIH